MVINCLHPVIILHPKALRWLELCEYYCIKGRIYNVPSNYQVLTFDRFKLHPRRHQITLEDVDTCFIFSRSTGEYYPLYLVVPCNKCLLCRDKRVSEWQMRCLAENQTSFTPPLFITLTYNNECRPKDNMPSKRDVQLFFKRLRQNLERNYNWTTPLRYILVSEHGKKNKQVHYHFIVWNYPPIDSPDYVHCERSLFDSWAFRLSCTTSQRNQAVRLCTGSLKHLYFYRRYKNKRAPYDFQLFKRLGFVFIKQAHCNTVGYFMKYILKDPVLPMPKGKCHLFLTSRGGFGGIGSEFIFKSREYYLQNPSDTTIEIVDKYFGQSRKCMIAGYFERKLWPSFCDLVPKKVRDAADILRLKILERSALYYKIARLRNLDIHYTPTTGQLSALSKLYIDPDTPLTPIYAYNDDLSRCDPIPGVPFFLDLCLNDDFSDLSNLNYSKIRECQRIINGYTLFPELKKLLFLRRQFKFAKAVEISRLPEPNINRSLELVQVQKLKMENSIYE